MKKPNALATTSAHTVNANALDASIAFVFDPLSVTLARKPTYSEWSDAMERMSFAHGGLQWWIGDLALLGEAEFGDKASQMLDHTHFASETVRVYRWVAQQIPPENRRTDLSFNHHVAVAALKPAQQQEWLEKAATGADGETWSAERLRGEIGKAGDKPVELSYLLIVDCGTDERRSELVVDLQRRGYRTTAREQTRRGTAKVTAKPRKPHKFRTLKQPAVK